MKLTIFTKIILLSFLISTISVVLGITVFEVGGGSVSYFTYIAIIILSISLFAAGSILEPIEKLKEAF